MAGKTVLDRLVAQVGYEDLPGSDRALRKFERGIDRTRRRLDTLSGAFFRVGIAASLPLIKIGKNAIVFDKQLRILEARSNATTEELERLKKAAIEAGGALPLANAEILKAQTALIQRGLTIEQALAATSAVAAAAVAAEGVSVEDAANYGVVVLETFKKEASEMVDVFDMMIKAERSTPASFRSIGDAMKDSAYTANEFNIELHEYIAILGRMAASGLDPVTGSKGLAQILTNIGRAMSGTGRGAKLATDAFDSIGISIDEVRGIMAKEGGFIYLLEMIQKRTEDMPSEYLVSFLAALSGTTYAAALGHVIENTGKLRIAIGEVGDAADDMDRQVKVVMKGVSGGFELAKAQLDTLELALADIGVSGPLEYYFRSFAQFVKWLTEADKQGKLVRRDLLELLTTIMKLGVGLIVAAVSLKIFSFLLGLIKGVLPSIRYLVKILKWLRAAFLAIAIAASVVGLSVGAVVAIFAAAAALIYMAWKPISSFFSGFFSGLAEGFGMLFGWVGRLLERLGPVHDAMGALLGTFRSFWNFLSKDWDTDLSGAGRAMANFIFAGNLAQPLPVAPAGATAGAGGGISAPVVVEQIDVHAPGGDPELIATQIGEHLESKVRTAIEDADTRIDR